MNTPQTTQGRTVKAGTTRTSMLERLWRIVHARLVMLAQGGTSSYNSDGSGHQKPGSKPPPAIDREVVRLERDWQEAKTDTKRHDVVMGALNLLGMYAVKQDVKKVRGTTEWKVAIADDPRSSRVVARMYGVSHTTVCEYRDKRRQGKLAA